MTKRERLTDEPLPGDYLTDGERLFEVTEETDSDGNYYLLDCGVPYHPNQAPEKVSTNELWKDFRVVHPD